MVRFGNFEVEYNRNAPDKVSVRIETDDKGEVWLPKCDIARVYGVFVQSVNAGLKSLQKPVTLMNTGCAGGTFHL